MQPLLVLHTARHLMRVLYTLILLFHYRTIIEPGAERKHGVNLSITVETERATVTRTT